MGNVDIHNLTIDGKDRKNLRGDPITSDRYFSKDFMQKEWDSMWTKVWLIAGREIQIKENDIKTMANRIFTLYHDDEKRKVFEHNAFESFKFNYNIENNILNIERIYRKYIN